VDLNDITAVDTFAKNYDLVVGAPGLLFLAGEHAVLDGALAIVQQIPRRVWVGLRFESAHHGKQLHGTSFEADEDRLRVRLPASDHEERVCDIGPALGLLSRLVQFPTYKDEFGQLGNIRLGILSEVRPNSGCNYSGALSAAIAAALHLYRYSVAGEPTINQLLNRARGQQGESFLRLAISGVLGAETLHTSNRQSLLDRINRMALVLETFFHGGSASGCGTLCTLLSSTIPIAYYREPRRSVSQAENATPAVKPEFPLHWAALDDDDVDAIETHILSPDSGIRYHAVRIDELLNWEQRPIADWSSLGFHFGLVFSGEKKGGGSTKGAIQTVEEWSGLLNTMSQRIYPMLPVVAGTGDSPDPAREHLPHSILDALRAGVPQSLRRLYSLISPLALPVLAALDKLHGAQIEGSTIQHSDATSLLCRAIWAAHGGLGALGLIDDTARRVIACIVDSAKEKREGVGVKYTGGGGGGYLLYVVHPSTSDVTSAIRKRVSQLSKDTQASVDYFSGDKPPDSNGAIAILPRNDEAYCSFEWNEEKDAWQQVEPFAHNMPHFEYNDSDKCVVIDIREPHGAEVRIGGKLLTKKRRSRITSRVPSNEGKRGMAFLAFLLRWLVDQPSATARFDEFVRSLPGTAFEGSVYAKIDNGRPDNFRKQVLPFSQCEHWRLILSGLQKGGSTKIQLRPANPSDSEIRILVLPSTPDSRDR
jgi:mevalonate kinase